MDSGLATYLVIGVACFAIYVWRTRARARRMLQKFQEVCPAVSGKVVAKGWLSLPQMTFRAGGQPARLRFHDTGGKRPVHYTDILVNLEALDTAPIQLRLQPEGVGSAIGKWFGMQDIVLGDPSFDSKFLIRGASESRIRALLDETMQKIVLDLLGTGVWGGAHVEVAVRGDELLIRKLNWLEGAALLEYLRLASRFCERLVEVASIDSPPADSRCPVCNDELRAPPRSCPVCGAAHHEECWTLTDGCGACASRRAG